MTHASLNRASRQLVARQRYHAGTPVRAQRDAAKRAEEAAERMTLLLERPVEDLS
jgi:hypothetical protein